MTRTKVVVTPIMEIKKSIKSDLKGGKLGLIQRRKMYNTVKDPRLLAIMACMASQLAGKRYPDTGLGGVQKAFREARKGPCKI